MYKVNFTCWAPGKECVGYWYEEVSNDMEALKASARIAWEQNKGPKRFKLSQIVKGGQDILIAEHNG